MEDYIKEAEARYAAQKQQRALAEIKRQRRLEDNKAALSAAIDDIKSTAKKSGDFAPVDMAAKYSRILDGLFDHYLEKSKNYYNHEEEMAMALKTHQQAVRSLYIWHKLKS